MSFEPGWGFADNTDDYGNQLRITADENSDPHITNDYFVECDLDPACLLWLEERFLSFEITSDYDDITLCQVCRYLNKNNINHVLIPCRISKEILLFCGPSFEIESLDLPHIAEIFGIELKVCDEPRDSVDQDIVREYIFQRICVFMHEIEWISIDCISGLFPTSLGRFVEGDSVINKIVPLSLAINGSEWKISLRFHAECLKVTPLEEAPDPVLSSILPGTKSVKSPQQRNTADLSESFSSSARNLVTGEEVTVKEIRRGKLDSLPFLTPFDTRNRERGYRLYLPDTWAKTMLYWTLGYGDVISIRRKGTERLERDHIAAAEEAQARECHSRLPRHGQCRARRAEATVSMIEAVSVRELHTMVLVESEEGGLRYLPAEVLVQFAAEVPWRTRTTSFNIATSFADALRSAPFFTAVAQPRRLEKGILVDADLTAHRRGQMSTAVSTTVSTTASSTSRIDPEAFPLSNSSSSSSSSSSSIHSDPAGSKVWDDDAVNEGDGNGSWGRHFDSVTANRPPSVLSRSLLDSRLVSALSVRCAQLEKIRGRSYSSSECLVREESRSKSSPSENHLHSSLGSSFGSTKKLLKPRDLWKNSMVTPGALVVASEHALSPFLVHTTAASIGGEAKKKFYSKPFRSSQSSACGLGATSQPIAGVAGAGLGVGAGVGVGVGGLTTTAGKVAGRSPRTASSRGCGKSSKPTAVPAAAVLLTIEEVKAARCTSADIRTHRGQAQRMDTQKHRFMKPSSSQPSSHLGFGQVHESSAGQPKEGSSSHFMADSATELLQQSDRSECVGPDVAVKLVIVENSKFQSNDLDRRQASQGKSLGAGDGAVLSSLFVPAVSVPAPRSSPAGATDKKLQGMRCAIRRSSESAAVRQVDFTYGKETGTATATGTATGTGTGGTSGNSTVVAKKRRHSSATSLASAEQRNQNQHQQQQQGWCHGGGGSTNSSTSVRQQSVRPSNDCGSSKLPKHGNSILAPFINSESRAHGGRCDPVVLGTSTQGLLSHSVDVGIKGSEQSDSDSVSLGSESD